MTVREGRDYLYLIWKANESRRQYIVGELSKNSQFCFEYTEEADTAKKEGFQPLVSFPSLDKPYYSETLFPVFESRLPDRKRKDIKVILQKYGMEEYEPYQLLKRSGARLPIDNLYFVDPIIDTNKEFNRKFFIAGVRHYIGCKGAYCDKSLEIAVGEEVYLEPEVDNISDKNAIKVVNRKQQLLGYIPRYYSSSICELIRSNRELSCIVLYVNKNRECDECIKLDLKVK